VQEGPPVIVDLSTSVVARGNIILAAKKGEAIPLGWAINQEGVETTDPEEALKGAVLPMAGAKGYALAMAVEILSGVLTGAAFGPHVQNHFQPNLPPSNIGHFFILLDVRQWMPLETYYFRMRQLIHEMKGVPRAKGVDAILYPGERRHQTYVTQLRQGVALPENVIAELQKLAGRYGMELPSPFNPSQT
jgi:LDH2 family malate/lactate/ureidoglycolate dehydrogenase